MGKTNTSILKFLYKSFLMVLPVIVPILILYFCFDPFMIYHNPEHETYYSTDPEKSPAVGTNKGMITIKNYKKRIKEGYTYNAYIFGSSISKNFLVDDWESFIKNGDDSVSTYHFDSSCETIYQLSEKINYLYKHNYPINHALIVLDPVIMEYEKNEDPYSISPPEFHPGLKHFLKYHYTFFRAAINSDFLSSWVGRKIYDRTCTIGRNQIFDLEPRVYDPIHNQETMPVWDSLITQHPKDFFKAHPIMESPSNFKISPILLKANKRAALEEIARIFDYYNTDYHIIIGSNRRKLCLHPDDLKTLENIFSPDRVHDYGYSLVNDLEVDTLNYDNIHYRPPFALKLMQLTYQK